MRCGGIGNGSLDPSDMGDDSGSKVQEQTTHIFQNNQQQDTRTHNRRDNGDETQLTQQQSRDGAAHVRVTARQHRETTAMTKKKKTCNKQTRKRKKKKNIPGPAPLQCNQSSTSLSTTGTCERSGDAPGTRSNERRRQGAMRSRSPSPGLR